MHIPDGYLSPVSAGALYAAALPFWYVAARRLRTTLSGKMVPLLSVFSALAFTIMMFNIPLPLGTSGHAVGGVLMAIILGPWAAVIGVSIALIIQALMFGDGGITAIGANCFNMAVVLPFVGYYVYKLISARAPLNSVRHVVGGAVGGYLALNAAALFTAVEFGLQPVFWHTADGTPLYAPYPLDKAIPAMMVGHLIAGLAEAFVTALVILYLQRANQSLLLLRHPGQSIVEPDFRSASTDEGGLRRRQRMPVLWVLVGGLIVLSPVGLLATNPAWGEWSGEHLNNALGFVPQGLQHLSGLWNAPLSAYGIAGANTSVGYALSALIGVVLVIGLTWVFSRGLSRPGKDSAEDRLGPATDQERELAKLSALPPIPGAARHRRRGFLERSVANLTGTMEATIFAEDVARQPGVLQRLDPRIKIVSFLGYLLAVSFARHLSVLLVLYLGALLLSRLGRVPLAFFLKRVWLLVPLFTGVVAAPAIFNFVTPGRAVLDLPAGAAITEQGLRTAAFLLLRVGTSVSFAVLLVLTSRWPALLKALRVLRVPQVFVLMLGMTHRYIFLLLHTANNMFLARQSRSVGRLPSKENRRWLTGAMGTLIGRSYQLSNEIYLAMTSRGFRGGAMVVDDFRIKRLDWLWIGTSLVLVAVVIWVEQFTYSP